MVFLIECSDIDVYFLSRKYGSGVGTVMLIYTSAGTAKARADMYVGILKILRLFAILTKVVSVTCGAK